MHFTDLKLLGYFLLLTPLCRICNLAISSTRIFNPSILSVLIRVAPLELRMGYVVFLQTVGSSGAALSHSKKVTTNRKIFSVITH